MIKAKLLRAGGWGIPFDDHGSGYDLGRKAVAAALEAFDGRGPQTVLMDRICQELDLGKIPEIVSRQLEQQQVAALFPLVMEAAREGDLVARHLCDDAARDLANLAVALLQRAGWTRRSTPVVTTGGVFKSSYLIRRAFARHFAASLLRRGWNCSNARPSKERSGWPAIWARKDLEKQTDWEEVHYETITQVRWRIDIGHTLQRRGTGC